MYASDSPYVADWFVVSLRWLILLGLTVSLAVGGQVLALPNILLFILAFWNIALTVLAGLNRRLVYHRQISLVADLLVAGLFFWLQDGFYGPAAWVGLLPVLSASLYFETRGGLLAAGIMAFVQMLVMFLQVPSSQTIVLSGGVALITLLLGGVFGYLSKRVVDNIRQMQRARVEALQTKQRVEGERLRAIYDLTSTLTATLNYQRVIESLLDLSLTALNPDSNQPADERLVSAVLLYSGDEMIVGSARRFTPADMRATLRGTQGSIGRAIEEDKPILASDVSHDPELSRFIALMGCNRVYCFPLSSGFNAYGVLLFGHPEAEYFTPDRCEVLDILGRQAVIAIQNATLYEDLVGERDRMLEVQEEARKKLARDLHDGPTQSVAAIAMRVNLARRVLEKNPGAAVEEMLRIEELARRTTKEIRHMLFTLRPLVLESQGLVAALQAMAEKMKETYSQNVIIKVDEDMLERMEVGKQGVVFYIVEEAVTNARKHAQAEHILIRLRPLREGLALLEIQDDGIGFDVEVMERAYDKRGSLGMINLRERTELINSLLHIDSSPGKGTNVQVVIPLTEEAADQLHHSR